jgi:predicted sulfurtransferase
VVNRPQILTDGLPPTIADLQEEGTDNTGKEWDWSGEVGIELEASQWHQELSAAKKKEEAHVGDGSEEVSSFPVLLDCRNDYESDAGRFQGAKALNTATFRCASNTNLIPTECLISQDLSRA